MPLDQLVLIVVFLLLPLIQFLTRRNEEAENAPEVPPPPQPLPRQDLPRPAAPEIPIIAGAPMVKPAARPVPGRMAVPRGTVRSTVAGLGLRNAAELRRAIRIKTVLDPCRAAQPYQWRGEN